MLLGSGLQILNAHPRFYWGQYGANADPAVEVERAEWEEDSSDRLEMALEKLDERSRSILKRRWMTDDKATLHELADEYGISAERVRQVESNAINKLKGLMAAA